MKKKTIEIDIDETIENEIKVLKNKIRSLENKITADKLKNRQATDLYKFTKTNRDAILDLTQRLIERLEVANWLDLDEYYNSH